MLDWNHIIASAGTLFLVLDPPGNAPLVQSLLQHLPPEQRRRILLRELCFVLVLMLFFFFMGKGLLGWLGISAGSLNLSGGIMLFIIAVGMVFPTRNSPHLNISNSGLFIVPVTVPLIIGPAAISVIMMKAAFCTTLTQKLECLASLALAWGATAVLLCLSGKILSLLGEKGTLALTRLMGTLLILLAVQMVLNGITVYITELSHG
ncbi:MAG: MarC family protein [Akkermansia sp.]|nr:MarC family protein [Akkermansia sp.]